MSFRPVANAALLSVGTTSSSAAIPLPPALTTWSHDVWVTNTGAEAVFVAFGATAPTVVIPVAGAPHNGVCVPAGASQVFSVEGAAYMGAIAASGTNAVYFVAGVGSA